MSTLMLRVQLPLDRTQSGTVALEDKDGNIVSGPFDVLGKADNARATAEGNPSRDPTLPYGDTPEGTYSVPRIIDTGSGTIYSADSFGVHEAIVLKPESGEALDAKNNGRTGLLLHGGKLGQNNRLRATHGCLRVSDNDMEAIMNAVRNASNNHTAMRCEALRLSVIVGSPADEGAGPDESDPPPGIDDILNPLPNPLP